MSDPRSSLAAVDLRCLVVVCHNGPVVFTPTARSLMEIGWGNRLERAKATTGFTDIDHYWSTSWPRVDALRDSAVTLALQQGHSHLLFLDADMVWPSDVIERMLRHHVMGIVGGLYIMKEPPYAPVALGHRHQVEGSQVDQFLYEMDYGTDLIEVDVLGMGCTLVPTAVFRALGPRPWFEYKDDDQGWPKVTEDVPLCLKAKAAGFKVYLDPTVKCGHVTTHIVDERYHKRFEKSREETAKRMRVSAVQATPEGQA